MGGLIMRQTKYIVYDTPLNEVMIIFGATQQHADIAHQLGVRDDIISAGFLSIGLKETDGDCDVSAYGDSLSLRVESRPVEDSRLARIVLGLGMW